ncbi:hypothetical protein PTI98_009356 [Pleurotus ostreatus]|nr:hypothetical protein PTI98_009356 [Pleurotus ostreatus]
MDEEGDEELGKMAKKQRTVVHPSGEESESDEKAAAAVRASQLPADSSNDAREAMDVDEQSEQCEPPQARVSVTPPPCGQPPRATQAPPSSMQTTGATQGSTGTDPMSHLPPVVHPPSDALAEWRETLREFIRESQFEVDENVLVGTPPLSNSGLDANMLAASINDISMYEESPPPPSGGTPPRSHKHSRPPEEVSPKADRRAHKRTAPSSEGEDFTTEMAGVRDSSPTNNNPYNLAIGATSQVDEPVPPLAFKPIKSKKDGMRSKTGSSKAGSSKHRSSTRR